MTLPEIKEHLSLRALARTHTHTRVHGLVPSPKTGFRGTGGAESSISKLSTELAPESLTHKYPLNNNADMHWTVNNKYLPETENTYLLNAAGAKGSMNVIRCNDVACNEVRTSAKTNIAVSSKKKKKSCVKYKTHIGLGTEV